MIAMLQAAGSGALLYCGLFAVLATGVYVDGWMRGVPSGTQALATLVLGWVGLAAYLAMRSQSPQLELAAVPVTSPALQA